MNLDESVTMWIYGLRQGNQQSAQQLWERYFSQLVRIAGTKLPRSVRREFDEEDVALSAFHSLCEGVKEGKFPCLDDRDNLWSLLVVITARKAMYRMRSATARNEVEVKYTGNQFFHVPEMIPQALIRSSVKNQRPNLHSRFVKSPSGC